jgi:hypothetical protein
MLSFRKNSLAYLSDILKAGQEGCFFGVTCLIRSGRHCFASSPGL